MDNIPVLIDNIENKQLGKLSVFRGIKNSQISKLIEIANQDKTVIEFTSDSVRFKTEDSFRQWLKKERIFYTLTNENNDLLGLIWYGKKEFPKNATFTKDFNLEEYGITYSIRTYGLARGKGLAKPFTNISFNDFIKSDTYNNLLHKKLWIITTISSLPAIKLYSSLGYIQVSKPDLNNRIILILEN